jgi:hypothetical protein
VLVDIVESLSVAPVEISKAVVRNIQSNLVNREVTKSSYHSTTLMTELMYKIYASNRDLLTSDWANLVEFSSTIYSKMYHDPLCLKKSEGQDTRRCVREESKLTKQLREYITLRFLLVAIAAWPYSDHLIGYKKSICKIIKDFYSTSLEITGHLLTSLEAALDLSQSQSEHQSAICWINLLNVYSALVQMLDQKNLDTETAEKACTQAFFTAGFVFKAVVRAVKADSGLLVGLALPVVEVINNVCSSKIARDQSDFTPLLEEYLDLIDVQRGQQPTDDQASNNSLPESLQADQTIRLMWHYFYFLLQAEGLDLNLCFKGVKLLVFSINFASLLPEDKPKLVQIVVFS